MHDETAELALSLYCVLQLAISAPSWLGLSGVVCIVRGKGARLVFRHEMSDLLIHSVGQFGLQTVSFLRWPRQSLVHSRFRFRIRIYDFAFAFTISHSRLRFRIRVYDFAFALTILHSHLRFRIRVYDFAFAFTILHSHLRFCFRVYDFAFAFTILYSRL